jgi:hypothetical protein
MQKDINLPNHPESADEDHKKYFESMHQVIRDLRREVAEELATKQDVTTKTT